MEPERRPRFRPWSAMTDGRDAGGTDLTGVESGAARESTAPDPPARLEPPVFTPVVEAFATAAGIVLCCDFDGTLAPIESDPDAVTPLPESQAALRALADYPDVEAAVISGRALDDVRERVGVDGLAYAGNHGLELYRDGERSVHPVAAKRRPTIRRLADAIAAEIEDVEGAFVEDKGVTATVHYRQASPEGAAVTREAVAAVAARIGEGIRITEGKEIRELRPSIPWDKGSAVRLLAADAPRGWLPAYVGDDTTDEDAFHAATDGGGIAIHVGDIDATAASYQLADPEAVAVFLRRLQERLTT